MSVIWKDGQFLDGLKPRIHVDDSGFSNGLGVFDTMLAAGGVLQDAEEHFERLMRDADIVLGINRTWLPVFKTLSEAWIPLLAENNLTRGHARVKTIVTGGIADAPLSVSAIPSVIITAAACPDPASLSPVTAAIIQDFPRIAGSKLENCKRMDYTRSFAARRAAQKKGADEAILTNTAGNIACAATSNIFIVENGVWTTPPLSDGVLAGITRANIIGNKRAREESITIPRLEAADEIYLTNSITGVRKVTLVS